MDASVVGVVVVPVPAPDVDPDEPPLEGCDVLVFCDWADAGLVSPLHAASRTGTISNAESNPDLLNIIISSLRVPHMASVFSMPVAC